MIKYAKIRTALMPFEGYGMRLCHIKTIKAVNYINDAAATNPNAGWYSLEATNSPIIWIMGGKHKFDYSNLLEVAEDKVKLILLIGNDAETRQHILKQFIHIVPVIEEVVTIEQATEYAYLVAKEGDSVLFSPSNKPEYGFNKYEQGDMFEQFVKNL